MSQKDKAAACFRIAAIFLAVSFASSFSHAADSLPNEPIEVNGDNVEYFQDHKKVVGSGNISIKYKDVTLTCDRITVYLDTREAIAEGNVRVSQQGAFFTGGKINYNFDTRQGTVLDGDLSAKPFYGKAQEVSKAALKDEYGMERGYVTTCDLDEPHYRIQARRVKIYLEDKVVAEHILIFLGKVPIAYLPYYVQPLRGAKKSHITVIPGESKDWGYYALCSYRYYFSDDNRGDILVDYRTKKGLAYGVNHYYDTKKIGDGAFKFYYTHENDFLVADKTGEPRERYRWQYRHKWDIPGHDTIATLEFNKLSDPDVIRDYIYNEYEELGAHPDNYFSVITQRDNYSMQFLARKRFDDFYTVVERLPEYKASILNYKFKDLPVYYNAFLDGVYLNKKFAKTDPKEKDLANVRLDVFNQLSYAARFFKALNVTPYAGVRETYYARNKWGDTNEIRNIFNFGVDNSIKFYRLFDVETNFLGLDIHKLRHIITPTVNFYHIESPTISPSNLMQFDEVDAIDAQNGFHLALENRLQTKRAEGEKGAMKSVDLATLIVSTDYNFRLRKNNWNIKQEKFENLNFKLELVPYSWAYLVADMTVDTKRYLVQRESIDLVMNGGDKWQAAIRHSFEDVQTGKSNLISFDGMYKINDTWRVRAYEMFDAQSGAFQEQEYTIYRDLHCWQLEFVYDYKCEGNHTFWVILKLKAFPEYPIGVKRTYSRPRFGAVGDSTRY